MSVIIPITKLGSGEAITLTETIVSTVDATVAEVGQEAVGPEVLGARDDLAASAKALTSLDPESYIRRRDVDVAADRCLSSIHGTCEGTIAAYTQDVIPLTEAERAELAAARLVQQVLFPEGIAFLANRWSDQYGVTRGILDRAAEDRTVAALATLGLTARIGFLRRIHEEYGSRMGYTRVLPGAEDNPLTLWHEALERYLASVIRCHRRNSALRDRLSAPYEDLARAVREASQSKSTASAAPAAPTSPPSP